MDISSRELRLRESYSAAYHNTFQSGSRFLKKSMESTEWKWLMTIEILNKCGTLEAKLLIICKILSRIMLPNQKPIVPL